MTRTQDAWAQRPPTAIRPACAADRPALRAFFAGLSTTTRYRRFFAAITPSAGMLAVLAGGGSQVDCVVAVRRRVIVGHAMAADQLSPEGAPIADIGVVVADDWQGHGLGSALVRALIHRAQARGVTALAMDVLPSNHQVLAMITAHWPQARARRSDDGIAIGVALAGRPQPARRAGRALAGAHAVGVPAGSGTAARLG